MESYTIDTEKIKCNAKRKIPERKRGSDIHRWAASFAACAAAAAVVVVSLSVFGGKRGVDITDGDLDSAIERVHVAEAQYLELSSVQDTMDVYVSFKQTLNLNEILIAFSAIDEDNLFKIPLLYTEEGKCYKNSDTLSDSLVFLGAKVTVPAGYFKELKELKCVSLVESADESKYTDKSFIPYSGSESSLPPVTIDAPVQIMLPEKTTSAETAVTVPPVTTSEITSPAPTQTIQTEPNETTDVTTETTTVSETEAGTQPEPKPIDVPVSGVQSARLISKNCIVVTTSDSIMLYKLDEAGVLSLDTTFYAGSAKLAWVSRDESSIFITACDSNGRNKLFYADGKTESLTSLDVSSITSGADIASVVCSNDGSVMIIKTISTDRTYIYRAERSENSITISLVKEYASAASALTYSNGVMYTAVTDASTSTVKVYAVSVSGDGETEIGLFGGSVRCVRNNALDAAVLIISDPNSESEQYKLLTSEGKIIGIDGSGDVTFAPLKGNVFKLGEKYYTASDDVITEISAEEAAAFFADTNEGLLDSGYSVTVNEDGTAYLSRIL